MRTTQRKGDYAVTKAISSFTACGMDVSLPITESAAYDLVVDDKNIMRRVQVRFSSDVDVELRRIHSSSSGYVIRKTKKDAYDWLYVLRNNGNEFLIKQCLDGRRSIRLKPKYKFNLHSFTSIE